MSLSGPVASPIYRFIAVMKTFEENLLLQNRCSSLSPSDGRFLWTPVYSMGCGSVSCEGMLWPSASVHIKASARVLYNARGEALCLVKTWSSDWS